MRGVYHVSLVQVEQNVLSVIFPLNMLESALMSAGSVLTPRVSG